MSQRRKSVDEKLTNSLTETEVSVEQHIKCPALQTKSNNVTHVDPSSMNTIIAHARILPLAATAELQTNILLDDRHPKHV